MSYYVLWIDHDQAQIFNFSPEGETMKSLENKHHHNHHSGHFEQEKKEQQKKFYADVGKELPESGKILLLGPSQAKLEFKKCLKDHQTRDLAESIVGIETLERLSEAQVRDYAKNTFTNTIFSTDKNRH